MNSKHLSSRQSPLGSAALVYKQVIRHVKTCSILLSAFVVAACASTSQKENNNQSRQAPTSVVNKIANKSFSTDTFYALLVAEMAIDRRRYDIALGNYLQQATITQDLEVTERATQIALLMQAHKPALEMALQWEQLNPDSIEASLIATNELIEARQYEEAFLRSLDMIDNGMETAFDSIAVKAVANKDGDIEKLSQRYKALLKEHPNHIQLLIGHSVLLQSSNKLDLALKEAKRAVRADPSNIKAGFQETRVLQQMGKDAEALKRLETLVNNNPDNHELRSRFARILSKTDLKKSQEQFEIIHQQVPQDPKILYALAMIKKERELFDEAKEHFKLLIRHRYHQPAAHYYMAEILEKQQNSEEALGHLIQVSPGQYYIQALANAATILTQKGRNHEAISLLQEEKSKNNGGFREGIIMLEAQVLSSGGQTRAAELALTSGIEEFPESTQLLYARAMLYSRIDHISAAEKDLRQVLEFNPNDAAALNALGYTLADLTDRYQEAYELIQQAYELSPNDPAVMDSLGWVKYRMGNTEEALIRLKQAMNAMPDHEIAAHLGEVLWVTEDREQAVEVWKQGLKLKPDSKIIHRTIHRLNAKFD